MKKHINELNIPKTDKEILDAIHQKIKANRKDLQIALESLRKDVADLERQNHNASK